MMSAGFLGTAKLGLHTGLHKCCHGAFGAVCRRREGLENIGQSRVAKA